MDEPLEKETIFFLYDERLAAMRDWPEEEEDAIRPPLQWPLRFVPLCNWGCGRYSIVDCSDTSAPVWHYSPDAVGRDDEAGVDYYRLVLQPEHDSLETWFEAWLANGGA